jgi:hypothetical protein
MATFKFTDGSKVYADFEKEYTRHQKGYVIFGPPASGKTTFVKNQKIKNWIDQDNLFQKLGVKWHQNENNPDNLKLNYLRCDYMSEQTKLLGFRIIGALFWNYIPDAIVIPPPDIHKKYIGKRKDLTEEKVKFVKDLLLKIAKENNVPIFETCEEATEYLDNL